MRELKEALESGKPLEIDCAKVIPRELYEPRFMTLLTLLVASAKYI